MAFCDVGPRGIVAVPRLINALRDRDPDIRGHAVYALRRIVIAFMVSMPDPYLTPEMLLRIFLPQLKTIAPALEKNGYNDDARAIRDLLAALDAFMARSLEGG